MSFRVASAALIAAALPGAAQAAATTIFTAGNGYTENFDSLAASGTGSLATLPAGFRVTEIGQNANATYSAGTGSNNQGDTYSFGNSADRALGGIQSGSLLPTIFGEFVNGSTQTITALTISYTGEQWRFGGTANGRNNQADRLDVAYSLNGGAYTDLDTLDFRSPVTSGSARFLDGNAAANRQTLSVTLDNLSLLAGQAFAFRWSDFNVTGADDGLAIDDFALTATFAPIAGAVPEPATWISMVLGFGLVGGAMRRRRMVHAA